MSKKEFTDYNLSSAVTLDNLIHKYGEEIGTKKYNDYVEIQRVNGSSKKYFIEKYGNKKGHSEWNRICKSKALTLTNFIRKYGEISGTIRYEEYLANRQYPYSKISQHLFWSIYELLPAELKEKHTSQN